MKLEIFSFKYQITIACAWAVFGQAYAAQPEDLAENQFQRAKALNEFFANSSKGFHPLGDENKSKDSAVFSSQLAPLDHELGSILDQGKAEASPAKFFVKAKGVVVPAAEVRKPARMPASESSGKVVEAPPVVEGSSEDHPQVVIDPAQFDKELNFPGPMRKSR